VAVFAASAGYGLDGLAQLAAGLDVGGEDVAQAPCQMRCTSNLGAALMFASSQSTAVSRACLPRARPGPLPFDLKRVRGFDCLRHRWRVSSMCAVVPSVYAPSQRRTTPDSRRQHHYHCTTCQAGDRCSRLAVAGRHYRQCQTFAPKIDPSNDLMPDSVCDLRLQSHRSAGVIGLRGLVCRI
jgi:hypothetical protein